MTDVNSMAFNLLFDQLSEEQRKQFSIDDAKTLLPLLRDAVRYRWLREQHWSSSMIAVVRNPSESVKLGSFCPAGKFLDEDIDKELASVSND